MANRSEPQCDALESAGLDVLRPDTDAYKARDDSYFSVSARLNPNCIVQPTSADETSKALTTLLETSCNVAVRSGGHMTWAGAANSTFEPTQLLLCFTLCALADDGVP